MKSAGARDLQNERIERALALGGLALILSTWRLWTPQNLFPRIPLFEALAMLPSTAVATTTLGATALCCAALAAIAIAPHRSRLNRASALLVAVMFVVLVLLDQHRLQPWCVHISVSLLLAAFGHPDRRLKYLIWFTASIYVYSALGKFDAQFLHTVGQDFVTVILRGVGLQADQVAYRLRFWMAVGFPVFELCVGLGLLFRWTRFAAAAAAIVMHAMLLWVLGPWGLHHAWGVLLWNGCFIALNVLMFLQPNRHEKRSNAESDALSDAQSPSDQPELAVATTDVTPGSDRQVVPLRFGLIESMLVCCIAMPFGERLGLVDHWLGWALYAPHSSRVQVQISSAAVQRLPAAVQPFIQCDAEEHSLWCVVRVDRWSLATLGAPVTPQQRFQIGVARALTPLVDQYEIRAVVFSTADRWTGRRKEHQLRGSTEIDAAGNRYWFSTTPCFNPPAN